MSADERSNSVVPMTGAAQIAFLGREFDDFLFSPIDENGGGMALTVLSALARQGVDPWREAAALAQLPKEDAARRLTSWIAALPDGLIAQREPGRIAARLIALLPGRKKPVAIVRAPPPGKTKATNAQSATAFAIFVAVLLGIEFVIAMSQSPARVGDTDRPAAAASSNLRAPAPGR